jgi:hypothetical protein
MDARDHARGLRRLLLAVSVAALVAMPAGAGVERFTGLQPPDLIELIGHIGKPFPQETGGWDLTLGVGLTATVYHYHLFNLRVINSGRLGGDILAEVEPYKPNFLLFGVSEEVAKLSGATPPEIVKITGWRRSGSRIVLVTEVVVSPAETPPPR